MKEITNSVSRQRFYQLKHRALGLCELCAEPAINRTHCLRHAQICSERQKTYMRKIKGKNWQPRPCTCRKCGETGHYAKTCGRPKV